MKKLLFVLIGLTFLFQFHACAIFNRENHRLVNIVEEKVVPKNLTLKIIAAPIYIPIGIVSGILDVFIIHPIAVLPKVADHTIDSLWTPKGHKYITTMGIIPFSMIATPFFFFGDWTYHWFFEEGPYKSPDQKNGKVLTQDEWYQELTTAFQSNQIDRLNNLVPQCYQYETTQGIAKLMISIHKKNQDHSSFYCMYAGKIGQEFYEDYMIEEFNRLNESTKYYTIAFFKNLQSKKGSKAVLNKILDSKTPKTEITTLVQNLFDLNQKEDIDTFLQKIRR